MKDTMKDFGKMVQDQKPSGNHVKCAEIKTLPTGTNAFAAEKQKAAFKIGEYNRATTSFEVKKSAEDPKLKFDLSADTGPCHYFKSLFARSVVGSNNSPEKCKSMDHCFLTGNDTSISMDGPPKSSCKDQNMAEQDYGEEMPNGCQSRLWLMPGKENWDLRRARLAEVRDEDDSSCGSPASEKHNGSKKSDIAGEPRNGQPTDRPGSRSSSKQSSSSTYNKYLAGINERQFEDVRLRSPLSTSCRSSFHRSYSSASDVDSVMLQSQVTTLEWQLRQAEASRQMYKAVMEQVVSFLQKAHRNLDILQTQLDDNEIDSVTRIPRSRSVHAVDTSTPLKFSSPRSETNLSFQKAKSFGQIGDPDCPKHGNMYREMTWRRPRKQQRDFNDLTPSKLSEEAFRLLRTIKSLLNTREPDLTSRINPANTTCSSPVTNVDVSSASSTVSATLESDNSERFLSRETSLVPQRKDLPIRQEEPTRRSSREEPETRSSLPSSADDESGFSSLSSFQEVGGSVLNSTFHRHKQKMETVYQEVGLPKVEDTGCKVHRRWSSTPVENHLTKLRPVSLYANEKPIKVLWV